MLQGTDQDGSYLGLPETMARLEQKQGLEPEAYTSAGTESDW